MDTNQPQQPVFGGNPIPPTKKSVGPMVGLVIVVILIILGGIYFWKEMEYKKEQAQYGQNDEMYIIESQSDSDEVSSIEADLQATAIDSIDTELGSIDTELQAQ
ncbi:MAG: hypothetical protein RJA61_326 [Candidatus Parcubacteria bacterium]|jgi:hypothetical protein